MHLRLAVLHVHNASLVAQDAQFGGRGTWRVNGIIPKASYMSIECRVQHRVPVPDANIYVAWPWTNETDSIVRAYADYNRAGIVQQSDSREAVSPLPPEHILRFLPGLYGFVVYTERAASAADAQRWPRRDAVVNGIPRRRHLHRHLHCGHAGALCTLPPPPRCRH